jgi:hypothetical protein
MRETVTVARGAPVYSGLLIKLRLRLSAKNALKRNPNYKDLRNKGVTGCARKIRCATPTHPRVVLTLTEDTPQEPTHAD